MSGRSRRPGVLVAASALAWLGLVASCSLGLDESLIDRADAGGEAGNPIDTGDGDAGDSGKPPPLPDGAIVCTKDEDCTTQDACLKGKCDLPRKACVFDVCESAVCTTAPCDTNAHTCGASKTHKYAAASFPVGNGIGCGGALGRCFAVVYPYVFVGTPTGVVAFSAADPGSATPAPVAVTGLGFVPAQILASGSRVFFLGGVTGAGTTSRVQLAWIDVPADPYVKTLGVQTVLAQYNRAPADPLLLYGRGNDSALLVDYVAASSYPATKLEPPLVEPLVLGSQAITFTIGSAPVTMSGTRLVMKQVNATGTPIFSFVNNAGDTPMNAGDVTLSAAAPVAAAPESFAASPDGAVLWVVESLTVAPGGPPPPAPQPAVRAVKAVFLVADGAANFDGSAGVSVDVDVYAGAQLPGAALIGPSAMLDGSTAIVTTAVPANVGQTNVQFVTKQPIGLVAGKKAVLAAAVGTLAAAASNGIGYILVSESPTAATVYVYDPACAP